MEAVHPRIVSAPELVGVSLLLYRPPPAFHVAAPHALCWRRPLSAASFRSSYLPACNALEIQGLYHRWGWNHARSCEYLQEVKRRKLNVSVVGIPKTVDNDIGIIDRSFGFQTAV
ncbi:hypothetical protein Taro_045644 [Colocasia esculenta]|uniref:Phosphofructokinase domain-containing protein n=1 Tax=Colocasia esculenta TaxID=4460 RepID=A0A843WXJ1_COLES|nr:hypothetical protein [Colocasia esculenta]